MSDSSNIDEIVSAGIAAFQKSNKDEGSESSKTMENKTNDETADPTSDVPMLPEEKVPSDAIPVNSADDPATAASSAESAYEKIFGESLQSADTEKLQSALSELMNITFGGI